MNTTTVTLTPQAHGALLWGALDEATGHLDEFYETAHRLRDMPADHPNRRVAIADALGQIVMARDDIDAVEALLKAGVPGGGR